MKSLGLPIVFGVLLLVAPSVIHADNFQPKGFTKIRSEQSPQGTFQIIYFRKEPNEMLSDSQIWLSSSKSSVPTQFLFAYRDDATCLTSPDEVYIAVNHHVLDGLDDLEIFVRKKNGIYRQVKKEFLDLSLKLMARQLKLKTVPDFDFKHCSADAWLRDGFLLCHLQGHDSGVDSLDEWYFIYDVRNDRFMWDLAKINHGAFHLLKN